VAPHIALIAQLVERWPEEPEVAGSIPAQCTTYSLASSKAALRLVVTQETVGSNPTSPATIGHDIAALAQRIRVPGFDPGGRRFESCTPHQW
jgi:hypothetical protein